jgi:hypothetical protein
VTRLLALAAAAAGLWALLRRRRRRSAPAELEPSPADELRARLAESRVAEAAPAEEPAVVARPVEAEVDGRRREVHERARQSIDELA